MSERTATSKPIEDYALLGNLRTAALVARDGSIDWLCLPRFDSGACFASLLDTPDAGRWRIAPVGATSVSRRDYVEDSLVLESRWDSETGAVRVLDFLPLHGDTVDVVRVVEGLSGTVEMESEVRLRFDYGDVRPWVRCEGHTAEAVAGPHAAWLRSPTPLEHHDGSLCSRWRVSAGDRAAFVLSYQASHLDEPATLDPHRALVETLGWWRSWMSQCSYQGRWQDEVRRSLVILKGLTYEPTGGILAAATTSLPEDPGGVRNWDYRFCWLRDATFTLQALLGTGFTAEAKAWREWLVRAVAGDPARLQIMYALDGSRQMAERELDWLAGHGGARPVRVGNAAAEQFQLDVWGEILDGLHLARESGLQVTETAWDLQLALLDWLEGHWQEPDNGLWEVRGPRRDFVHSKVMAWAGLDRAVRSVERHGLDGPVDRWRATRDQIHAEVCARGFDTERDTFTQSYGSKGLDAALLLIPRVGFLPWDDPRVIGTIDAVQRQLTSDGFLLRYDPDEDEGDGLPGSEGVFLACTFWLADALHGAARHEEAEEVFARLAGLRNDVGMLSEEYDIKAHRQLGNTPQAYSLVGLVNTARHLSGTHTRTSANRGDQGF
ncbi:glycoside hydrolase family 15 protein [Nocardioides panacisoli]|uniref:Glycoside hydrolase family 15 protein n=1 Tax=Nocardioides panacisoli TaxID=627624 RepID=A0ABP7J8A9_9ACTN